MDNRQPWEVFFLDIAEKVSERATCPRASVGCVLVLDNNILATGYNGAPAGEPHCTDVGCFIHNDHCLRATHAEINAIGQAAMRGIPVKGATAYVTHEPCVHCQHALMAAGVMHITMRQGYGDLHRPEFPTLMRKISTERG